MPIKRAAHNNSVSSTDYSKLPSISGKRKHQANNQQKDTIIYIDDDDDDVEVIVPKKQRIVSYGCSRNDETQHYIQHSSSSFSKTMCIVSSNSV